MVLFVSWDLSVTSLKIFRFEIIWVIFRVVFDLDVVVSILLIIFIPWLSQDCSSLAVLLFSRLRT